MKTLITLLLCFFAAPNIAFARPKKIDSSIEKKIFDAINYNFDACNRENIEDVMDSCADTMPGREEFRKETLKLFEEKDIHYSLVSVEVIDVKPNFALVKMVQKSHMNNRESKNVDKVGYRNQTGLLTKEETVEYLNTLKCENGTWKLFLIVSEMKPVVEKEKLEKDDVECVNGTCRPTPFDLNDVRGRYNFKPPER